MALTQELDAVNDLLMSISQLPLAAFSSAPAPIEEQQARAMVAKHFRKLLLERTWKDNYEEGTSITADGSGNMLLHANATPSAMNVIRLTLHEDNPPFPYGVRRDVTYRLNGTNPSTDNWQVYDILNKTFNMGAGVVLKFNIWRHLSFDILPEPYRVCAVERAKVEFLVARQADKDKIRKAALDADTAYGALVEDHLYRGGIKSFKSSRESLSLLDHPTIASWVGHQPRIDPL